MVVLHYKREVELDYRVVELHYKRVWEIHYMIHLGCIWNHLNYKVGQRLNTVLSVQN